MWTKPEEAPIVRFVKKLSEVTLKVLELQAKRQALQGMLHLKSMKYSAERRKRGAASVGKT